VGETADEIIKPPWYLLILGGISALFSLVLLLIGGRPSHVAGYVLGTFGVITVIAQFRRLDARRSSSPLYSPVSSLSKVAVAILIVGVGCGIANVYYLAQRAAS
jgi:hypothetical protein